MSDACITYDHHRSLLAVDQKLPRTAIMLQMKSIW
jgi:hypothetical protein